MQLWSQNWNVMVKWQLRFIVNNYWPISMWWFSIALLRKRLSVVHFLIDKCLVWGLHWKWNISLMELFLESARINNVSRSWPWPFGFQVTADAHNSWRFTVTLDFKACRYIGLVSWWFVKFHLHWCFWIAYWIKLVEKHWVWLIAFLTGFLHNTTTRHAKLIAKVLTLV